MAGPSFHSSPPAPLEYWRVLLPRSHWACNRVSAHGHRFLPFFSSPPRPAPPPALSEQRNGSRVGNDDDDDEEGSAELTTEKRSCKRQAEIGVARGK